MKTQIIALHLLKRQGYMLLGGIMLVLTITLTASATTVPSYEDRIIFSPEAAAQALYELNLFKGTEHGFELERGMTRAEAAVMLVRFLGGEEEALANDIQHPFVDVPEWAGPYIGWLFANGLTLGTGQNRYSPFAPITYEHYALFLVRSVDNPGEIAKETYGYFRPYDIFGITGVDENEYMKKTLITRGEAAILSVHALSLFDKNGKSNALKLIEKGVFSGERFLEHIGPLLGEQHLKREVLFEYTLCYLGEETLFMASGAMLYRRDDENLIAMYESNHESRCAFEILYMDEQKTVFNFAADKAYIFYYDTLQQKLVDTGLSLNNSLHMEMVYGKKLYIANDTDIYILNLTNTIWQHIYSPGKAINSPDGVCIAPGGIVAILQDGSFIYLCDEGATVIFPQLKHEYWAYDTAIISYDGAKLTLRNKTMAEKAGGEMIFYSYIIVAESDKATCISFEKIFHYADEESIMEVDEELRRAYIADFQKWLDELYILK